MLVPNRHDSLEDYRYGFQGQEKDDEIKGEGNSLNYTYRMHDPRVGRFFAMDPLAYKYPELTPYQFSSNTPIMAVELEGLETAFGDRGDRYYGSSAYLKKSTAERSEEAKMNGLGALLGITTLIDIYVTKGKLSQAVTTYFLGGVVHSAQMQTYYRDQGNEFRAKQYEQEGAEASIGVILGLAAEGAIFGIGKIAKTVKNWKVKLVDSNIVNAEFKSLGYAAPYKANVSLGVMETTEEVSNLVRLSGPNNVKGSWVTTAKEIEGLSAAQLKDKFSLKYEPTLATPISIEAKSTIRVGEAAGVKEFGTNGGGYQIEVLGGKINYGKSTPIK
jgi:RHS repeat-associated protein